MKYLTLVTINSKFNIMYANTWFLRLRGLLGRNLKVNEGKGAEKEVTDYVDSLVTSCNPCTPEEGWVRPKVHP